MRYLILALTLLAATAFGANKNLRAFPVSSLNDRPVLQSFADSSGGQGDTLFYLCGDSACTTSMFNKLRNAVTWDGMGSKFSQVVVKNPDSIRCNFLSRRVDADTSDVAFGLLLKFGSAWNKYGGTTAVGGTATTNTKFSVTFPWAASVPFRPFFVTTTATDTNRVPFMECRDITNPQ